MRTAVSVSINFLFLSFFTLILLHPGTASARDDSSGPRLLLQNRQLDPINESLSSGLVQDKPAPAEALEEHDPESRFGRILRDIFTVDESAVNDEKRGYYIVQFQGPVRSEWKQSLSALGITFYDYIPQYSFIIKSAASNLESVKSLEFVRWVGEYEADLKFSRQVYNISPEKLREQGSALNLRIVAFPDENISELRSGIVAAGGTVTSTSSSKWSILFDVKINIENAVKLKDITGVKWVEKAPEHRTDNNIAVGIMEIRSEQARSWPVSGTHLLGEGQIVGICDSGLDTGDASNMHKDFSNGNGSSRVTDYVVFEGATVQDKSGHGTHVAGAVAGNGLKSGADPLTNSFPSTCYAGVAPKVELFCQSAGTEAGDGSLTGIPRNLNELFQPAYDAGVRIHTNSWGTAGAGDYSAESRNVDEFMWTNKDFLILYAAGNAGYDKDMDGVTDLYSIDSPATAKNCLSVGATESYRVGDKEGFSTAKWKDFRTYAEPIGSDLLSDKPYGMAAFSSRGPTMDGRYKPEVVAPGTNILSTRSSAQLGDGWGAFNDDYYWSGGTSMATPLVAGMAAIMREYLIKEEGFADPSAALIKTSLIHGAASQVPGQYGTGAAQEITSAPDDVQGWGRVDFESSINSDSRYRIEYSDIKGSSAVSTGDSRTFSFEVKSGQKPFRATLGWTDYPGSVAAVGGLVNDLDLRVMKPDGTWVYPDNAVSSSPLQMLPSVSSANGYYGGEVIGSRLTPPSYPCNLEFVMLAYYNSARDYGPVSIVIYNYDGGVGDEIFRKTLAYIPSGEHAIPLGLTITEGSIVVAVENAKSTSGVYYQSGNPDSIGMVKVDEGWVEAPVIPALRVGFRTKVESTDFDRLNNSVSVCIDKPEAGIYTAEVSAYNVPVGPQPYALILSGMTEQAPTEGEIELNSDRPDAPISTFLSKSSTVQTVENINRGYGTGFEEVYSDEAAFSVQAPAGSVISIKYPVSGLPEVPPQSLTLAKLFSNGTNKSFSYASLKDYSDGKWWLTDLSGKFVSPVVKLDTAKAYYAVSVIKDNGIYDENPDLGVIDDPQILGLKSSSSGCTIGTGEDFGHPLLLVIALISLVLRRFASRRSGSDNRYL